jgi:hypothetical protein
MACFQRRIGCSANVPEQFILAICYAEEDGDGLDVLIVSQAAFQPGTFARVKVIGIMGMIDTGEQDDKLVAVAADDPMYRDIENLDQLGEQQLGEIQRFFEDYKRGEEGRYVNVTGYQGPEEAQGTVQEAVVSQFVVIALSVRVVFRACSCSRKWLHGGNMRLRCGTTVFFLCVTPCCRPYSKTCVGSKPTQ